MFGRGKALFHLQRYEEAESTFARLRALHPDITVAHEGFARAAEKSGRWTRALEGWTAATLLEPDRLVPLRGKAKAEAALGLDDAAEASFMRLSRIHPSSQAGFRGAAGLAEKRGDWPRALAIYDELWARFADVDAIRQKASILIRLQRIEEARQIADILKPPAGPALTYLLAASPVYEHLHDWPAMNQLLQRHEAEILSDGRLVRTYVNMLVRLGRMDEALRLTDRSSADIDEARNLRVATLIHARRYDEADAILAGILAGESFSGLRVELLAPLVTAAWEAGGASLARSIVDRIESEAPRNRTGEVLRLLVPFHRLRLWFLEGLFSSPPRLEPPVILPEKAVASLVDQWRALPEAAFGYDFTREVCALIGELRAASPVFPDTSFDLRDALEVALRIVRAVDELQPLSLVRLGDGEGVLLPYRTEYRHFQQADRSATKRAWWGDEADVEMEEIARHLKEAAIGSTLVGIPDLYRICLTLLSRSASDITEGGRSARGILAVIDYVKTELAANVQVVTSCHIHQSFSYWGLWDLLLPRIGRLSLVTCQEKLAEFLSSKYEVTIDAVHLIPPEQKYARGFASARTGRHYPLVFEELRGKLAEAEPGQVFLVAAGVLGKVYCTWIKQAGGIAIDIGSAADFWCGHETRSIADGGNYRSPAGTAESMRQLLAGHTRFGILLGTPPAGAARSYDGADELAAGRMP